MNAGPRKPFDDPIALHKALSKAWSSETASPSDGWSTVNRAKNHCSVTALIVQDFFGGDILKTKTSGGTHFYNRFNRIVWDLTMSQFSEPIPYEDRVSSRDEAMADTSESKYRLLLDQIFGDQ